MPRKATKTTATKAESKTKSTRTGRVGRPSKQEIAAREAEKIQEEKIDVVEQARKELARLEAEAKVNEPAKKFPWGIFGGAVLITIAVMLIGWKVWDMFSAYRLSSRLPEIIEPLGGGLDLEKVGKPTKTHGVYSFTIKFKDYDEEFTSYITKDAKLLFVDGYDVEELLDEYADMDTSVDATLSCESLTKSESPILDVYVSSDCGYCKQAELQMYSAVQQVPALADQIVLHYAGSVGSDGQIISFLGSEAAGEENLRQVCIRDEQHDVFWDYVSCMSAGGETESCQAEAGVNTASVDACMASDTRGLAAITADINRANELSVTGTPSFFVNDEESVNDVEFGGGQRIPDAYKEIICCASSEQPDFCSTTLEEAS